MTRAEPMKISWSEISSEDILVAGSEVSECMSGEWVNTDSVSDEAIRDGDWYVLMKLFKNLKTRMLLPGILEMCAASKYLRTNIPWITKTEGRVMVLIDAQWSLWVDFYNISGLQDQISIHW